MATVVTNIPFTVREALTQIKDAGHHYTGPMTNKCIYAVLDLLLESFPNDVTNPAEPTLSHKDDGKFWVDTGHADVGPFDNSADAAAHCDRIMSDRVRLVALMSEQKQ